MNLNILEKDYLISKVKEDLATAELRYALVKHQDRYMDEVHLVEREVEVLFYKKILRKLEEENGEK